MHSLTWIATTKTSQWQSKDGATTSLASEGKWDVEAQLEKPLQTIDGFGACFNELGWTALSALDDKDRDEIFRGLFAPGVGLNFNICRMPVGANDFSRDWYSYDEMPWSVANIFTPRAANADGRGSVPTAKAHPSRNGAESSVGVPPVRPTQVPENYTLLARNAVA